MTQDADFQPDWAKYPRLAGIFKFRSNVENSYFVELREMLREARADAVRFVEDVKAEELQKAFDAGCAHVQMDDDE